MLGLRLVIARVRRLFSGRARLRTLLLYVNLVIVVLPITGIWTLRIWENELMRRTEAELIAQASFVRAAFTQRVAEEVGRMPSPPSTSALSHPFEPEFARFDDADELAHIPAKVDLNVAELHPPAELPRPTDRPPAPHLLAAGEPVSLMMRDAQRVTFAGMRVVDHRGVVVATSRAELGESLAHRPEVSRALRGEYVRLLRSRVSDSPMPPITSLSRRSDVRIFVAIPITSKGRIHGAVIVSRTPMSLLRALYENRGVLIAFACVLMITVLVLTLYTSATIVRPVHGLIEQTERLGQGDADALTPLEKPVTYEVELLSVAITDMARNLHERSDYIRTFAAHVSHEFKTPLTSIRGTVELLTDHLDEMSPEERARFLTIVDRDAQRLQTLVTRLLELARADAFTPNADAPPAHALRILDDVVAHAADRHPHVALDAPDDLGLATIDAATLGSILTNLVDNALQHGGEDVHIDVLARVEGDTLTIDVVDDGPGPSEANRDRLFTPFFTTARDAGGTGLGLATIRALARAHRGDVVLLDGSPTTFRLTLPHLPSDPT